MHNGQAGDVAEDDTEHGDAQSVVLQSKGQMTALNVDMDGGQQQAAFDKLRSPPSMPVLTAVLPVTRETSGELSLNM